jgi:heptosyltransferase-1
LKISSIIIAMHILIVKTSSLGDVIHTLPALTDAWQHYSELQCDWVIEESFAEIPRWHPTVKRVIPVALRRWRQRMLNSTTWREWQAFKRELVHYHYDYIIDAQGLIKSAWLTYQAKGERCGLNHQSARESLASFAYQHKFSVAKRQHAVERLRQLFAKVLNYPYVPSLPDYCIQHFFPMKSHEVAVLIFLHGTTWLTKQWGLRSWQQLARLAVENGYIVRLPWGNREEYVRAQAIATIGKQIQLLPKTNLMGMAVELSQAKAVVGVDTGLAHLAAALGIPSVTLYGATQPAYTGTYGERQVHLQADFPCAPCFRKRCRYQLAVPPCYDELTVERVWQTLQQM